MNVEDLELRKQVLGKALCFLRLAKGIESLRQAGRLYCERVDPEAAKEHFTGQLSKWERGTKPSVPALLDFLVLVDADLSDFQTALDVMAKVETSGIGSLRQASRRSLRLRERLLRLAGSKKINIETVLDAAERAQSRE